MGVVSGICSVSLSFTDYVTSGLITPETLTAVIASPAIAGALLSYTNGTGPLQIDGLYAGPLTLAAATTTLDLTSLAGLGGESLDFARVRELILFNPDSTPGHDVKIYQGTSNGRAQLPASSNPLYAREVNGSVRLSDPNSTGGGNGNVTGGSSKTITLDPGAHTVTVYLIVAGGSAA